MITMITEMKKIHVEKFITKLVNSLFLCVLIFIFSQQFSWEFSYTAPITALKIHSLVYYFVVFNK